MVIIGIGEIGGVFARGFLKCGYAVHPVNRGASVADVARLLPDPALVLVAVGEGDLAPVLDSIPQPWRKDLVLLQNELLPRDWQARGLDPTVVSVWFEKKRGQDVRIVVPSPVYGRHAGEMCAAMDSLEIPCTELRDPSQLQFELVRKNLYILVTNICGLKVGGTVAALWREHQEFARDVAADVLDIQERLTGVVLDRDALIAAMVTAFEGDPEHKCMGRSAPQRLARAIAHADAAGLEVPALRALQDRAGDVR